MTIPRTLSFDGSIDAQLTAHWAKIVADIKKSASPSMLRCFAVGGGYGRGEGGVLNHGTQLAGPYNDYDLIAICPSTHKNTLQGIIAAQQGQWQTDMGIHVDVEVIAEEHLPQLPHTLTWYELGQGHQVISGDATLLRPLTARTISDVHPSEWGRLLVNRAMGLEFASWRQSSGPYLIGGDEDAEAFCIRQIYKAWLALGDVFLADRGCYHHLLTKRRETMATLSDAPSWAPYWQRAANEKFTPTLRLDTSISVHLDVLRPLFSESLAHHSCDCDRSRILVDTIRSLQHLPVSTWCQTMPPWTGLRTRISSELQRRFSPSMTHTMTNSILFHAWKACA